MIRRRINRLASWPGLAHRLGTNGFFVDLAAHARHTTGARLGVWWSERTWSTVIQHPAGPVWAPLGATGRVRLAHLPTPPGD